MGKVLDEAIINKSLEGLSTDDKIKNLTKKLIELDGNNAKLKERTTNFEKLTKVNDMLEKKLEKANQVLLRTEESKSKLEELCRGLQRLNQQIRDESMNKMKKLETERQEAVEHLRTTLKDIETSMNAGKERSDALAEDNRKLAEKLQELGREYEGRVTTIETQYEKKEKYWEELLKTRDIEIKLVKTRLEASSINVQKLGLEKDELAKTVLEETARFGGAIETERMLREQVKQYADKYAELTESLSKSNSVFDKFKKEIDRVNSNCRKVESDVNKWRQKYEEASRNVLVLTMANKELVENSSVQDKKLEKLESLCRALSARTPAAAPTPAVENSQ
ncbi:unnamed protein product [Caenorhabditis auriculariae]|uniref:Uncharacterized protein n=1 Tax=Caenorhabditis auriculariae TaxID=2777116 RepID=A0A8S1GMT3_9PELO|nr:unnamed protein product [Caenorhabditis auriculariae]